MNQPLISVIVPTYQRDTTLIRALDSLLIQTYHPLEIVVIDDNKEKKYRDKVKAIEADYLKKAVNIKFIYNEKNLGGAGSRNVGVKHSQGAYVTFLDDDDIYLKDKIKKQYQEMVSQSLDLSLTNLIVKDEKGKILEVREHQDLSDKSKKDLVLIHFKYHLTGTPTFMFKRVAFDKIGGFNITEISQEFYLMYKAIDKGLKIGYLDQNYVVAYRISSGGITTSDVKIQGEKDLLKFKQEHEDDFLASDRRYINTRSKIAIAAAYLRRKEYFFAFIYTFYAFLISPIAFLKILRLHLI